MQPKPLSEESGEHSASSKRCRKCDLVKPVAEFSWHRRARDGLQSWCRECTRASTRARSHAKQGATRAWLDEYKMARGCADCGYREHPEALEFDHLPGRPKLFNISQRMNSPESTLRAEIAKCEVVCANCHRLRTYARRAAS